jgi:hypothetical protein
MEKILMAVILVSFFLTSPLISETFYNKPCSGVQPNIYVDSSTVQGPLDVPLYDSYQYIQNRVSSMDPFGNSTGSGFDKSFHTIISGQKFWKAIKFNLTKFTIVRVQLYFRQFSLNDSSVNFFFQKIDDSNNQCFFFEGNSWINKNASPDYYIQYNFGPFSRSHYHTGDSFKAWGPWGFTFDFDNEGQTCYTIASYTNYSLIELWVNYSSDDPTISVTEGTNVFAYERHNFIGNLNLGWKKGTFIQNGKINIPVENHLVAWYQIPTYSTGHETLRYGSPTGREEWVYYKDKNGSHIFGNCSPDFEWIILSGQSGTWRFSVDMINMGRIKATPNVALLGADIRYPD